MELVTTAALLRAKEEILFSNVSDSDLIEVKYSQSLRELDYDLQSLYNIQDVQSIIDENTDFFQEMLALKQICLYLMDTEAVEGSMNYAKLKYYHKQYDQRLKQAVTLRTTNIPRTSTVTLVR